MFAKVRFGADRQMMVNLFCSIQVLTGYLKWKCQCRPEGTSTPGLWSPGDCHSPQEEQQRVTNGSRGSHRTSQNTGKGTANLPLPRCQQILFKVELAKEKTPQADVGHTGAPWASFTTSVPPDCIDLVDEKGTLMNLSKVEDPASEYASKYLQGRQHYILVRVVREENSEATCYESLLEDLEKHYPDLPDQLQQLSGKIQRTDHKKKGSLQKTQPHTSTQARDKTTSQSKKSLKHKNTPK